MIVTEKETLKYISDEVIQGNDTSTIISDMY